MHVAPICLTATRCRASHHDQGPVWTSHFCIVCSLLQPVNPNYNVTAPLRPKDTLDIPLYTPLCAPLTSSPPHTLYLLHLGLVAEVLGTLQDGLAAVGPAVLVAEEHREEEGEDDGASVDADSEEDAGRIPAPGLFLHEHDTGEDAADTAPRDDNCGGDGALGLGADGGLGPGHDEGHVGVAAADGEEDTKVARTLG